MTYLLFIAAYLICFLLIAGWLNADLRGELRPSSRYEEKRYFAISLFYSFGLGILGPIGCGLAYLMTSLAHHGWSLRIKREQK